MLTLAATALLSHDLVFAATAASGYTPTVIALITGFVIALSGHIIRSTTLIVTGIIIIGGASAYFTFGLSRVT